ncbi:hypothetical protein WR25_16593 [Diploscapter pachys]|uniref:DNA binding HTH domain-containing protein n=1 Tax=Diploscapter pachys TaxID=2018661 RepID=A0A2A2M4R0_9BILA|nr:hypothetical protein WR25_16593 [Diploscapter pachys]
MSEFQAIREMLAACGGSRVETARRLGISERTLRYRLAKAREQAARADPGTQPGAGPRRIGRGRRPDAECRDEARELRRYAAGRAEGREREPEQGKRAVGKLRTR